eukprot:1619104-Pleurochrysis_carterae.AAC.1
MAMKFGTTYRYYSYCELFGYRSADKARIRRSDYTKRMGLRPTMLNLLAMDLLARHYHLRLLYHPRTNPRPRIIPVAYAISRPARRSIGIVNIKFAHLVLRLGEGGMDVSVESRARSYSTRRAAATAT